MVGVIRCYQVYSLKKYFLWFSAMIVRKGAYLNWYNQYFWSLLLLKLSLSVCCSFPISNLWYSIGCMSNFSSILHWWSRRCIVYRGKWSTGKGFSAYDKSLFLNLISSGYFEIENNPNFGLKLNEVWEGDIKIWLISGQELMVKA